ncbi:MAG: glycosyltransferase [Bacteroidia bacterium]|nr:glycosyltransferase [Bacteroidia bacterium]NNJ54760.1 glycosyltransferase [Bacteroidia bacterium]
MMVILYIVIVLLFAGAYLLLLTKYGRSWELIEENIAIENTPFSITVLIPFRNEANNLPALIQSFTDLETDKNEVEFLFINDHSSDEGAAILKAYKDAANFRLEHLKVGVGKKAAVRYGWECAKGDIIIQTDADCIVPKTWLLEMIKPFANDSIQLVSGPVNFAEQKGFWFDLVSLDFAGLIAIGAAHIQMKKPMICNGANLAYRKKVLLNADLKEAKASGDDIFLMQSIASRYQDSISFRKSKEAMVVTKSPQSLREFWNQRIRWASKNGNYSDKSNVMILIGVWLYNVLILVSLLSFNPIGYTSAAFLVIIKWLAEERFYSKFESFFGRKSSFIALGIGQVIHIIYMAILPIASQMISYQWKERKLK